MRITNETLYNTSMRTTVDIQALADAMFQRRNQGARRYPTISLRCVADEIGVSAATISRIERGKTPDLETYAKICTWLGVPLDRFVIVEKAA